MPHTRRVAGAVARPAFSPAREAAVVVLSRADRGAAFANLLLRSVLDRARLSEVDAALATELVLGVLRHLRRVDWTLEAALRHGVADLPPRIRAVLRTAVYQLLFLPRIPVHAAVDEAVRLARLHGHAGTTRLTNAVLRRIAAQGERALPAGPPAERIAVEHSHPRWLVDRWIARWGEAETEALCRANLSPPPATARVNTLRWSPTEAVEHLRSAGVTVAPTALPEGVHLAGSFPERARLVEAGWLTMQDLGAMLVTHVLDPRPEETVLDGTAAPGGKTTHIAERMGDRGRIVACDVHAGKLRRLSARVSAMGITIVEAHHRDARELGRAMPAASDRLLLDLPCTGLGVVRRRPDIKWRVRPGDLPAMAALQGALLRGAIAALRPGGILVYSVCSPESEEGPDVVAAFLREHREVELEGFALPEPLRSAGGATGTALLLPHRHGTDGFFIARLRVRAAAR